MIPALVQWEITDRCPYHCPHCYHTNSRSEESIPLGLSEKEMLRIAEIIAKNQLFFVTFTGGEPLVRKEILITVAQYLRDHKIVLSLNTCLAPFDDDVLRRLPVDRMLISCPSSDPDVYCQATGNGNYSRFEQKLGSLIESQKSFTVNMVVTKLNKHSVRDTAVKMAKLGVERFAATPASINANSPNFSLLLSQAEVRQVIDDLIWVHEELGLRVDIMESIPKCLMPLKAFELELPFVFRSCHAGKRNGTIGTNGEVRPCSHNPQTFGNILKEDIGQIWRRMADWRENSGNFHQDCLGCDLFNNCGGGCRVDAQVRRGSSDAKHPYMIEKLTSPPVEPQRINLRPQAMIRPVKSFQSRAENGGWLVAPGSPRNIIHVNQTLYDFLVATRNLGQMTLESLAARFGTSFTDKEFQRIITLLTRRQFFIIE